MRRAFALLLSLAALALAGEGPRIYYSKYFKGSVPEFVAITIDQSGHTTYQEAPQDDRPLQFDLTAAQTSEIFGLSAKLDHFHRPLESPAKVAHMGTKTFRFEDGPAKSEVKFNYSDDPAARQLADWFERITETEGDYVELERAVKFDKLGVNQALLRLQLSTERQRTVAPQQFLPLLDRISRNDTFMHMSRERASSLAETFRKTAPESASK